MSLKNIGKTNQYKNFTHVRNKLGVLENRDREDKNIVLFTSYVCVLYTIAIDQFIGYKEESERPNAIKVHFTSGSYKIKKRLRWTSTKFSTKDNYS
jgi:hypothetical protein